MLHSHTLYLVRHFQAQIQAGICYGQSDIPFAAVAADDFARLLAQLPDTAEVFSSPSQRCLTLAQQVFPSLPITVSPLLLELNFGGWELKPWDLIARTDLDNWAADPLNFAAPQGESFAELCRRVQQFVQQFLVPDRSAVIFTHAGIIKAFLYLYAEQSLDAAISHSAPLGSITSLHLPQNISPELLDLQQ